MLSQPGIRGSSTGSCTGSAVGDNVPGKAPFHDISTAALRHALALAEEIGAGAVIVHADRREILAIMESLPVATTLPHPLFAAVPASAGKAPLPPICTDSIPVPQGSFSRASRIELSLLFALSLGHLARGDRVVSVLGPPDTGRLDSVLVSDLDATFDLLFPVVEGAVAEDPQNQVLARAIGSRRPSPGKEERESRSERFSSLAISSGSGATASRWSSTRSWTRRAARSIMDPSLEETIKEFSRIDGAFILRGDGVIMSAGTYLTADPADSTLPSGYGSRHRAAAAITTVTDAVSLAVSESTRKISLFRRGERFSVIE